MPAQHQAGRARDLLRTISEGSGLGGGGGSTDLTDVEANTAETATNVGVQTPILTNIDTNIATILAGTDPVPIEVVPSGDEYETVATGQTAQVLGATGAAGDYLDHVVCFPTSTTPGVVTILDNATTWGSFPGGVSSISTLHPFTIDVRATSVSGAWKITTGANISCVCVGDFT